MSITMNREMKELTAIISCNNLGISRYIHSFAGYFIQQFYSQIFRDALVDLRQFFIIFNSEINHATLCVSKANTILSNFFKVGFRSMNCS